VRAVVLVPVRPAHRRPAGNGGGSASVIHSPEDRLAESAGLARAIQLDVVAEEIVPLPQPRPATLFGSGKVAELAALVEEREAALAVVDHSLSPVQQRNLEKAWSCKVLDRTGLILEIFGAAPRWPASRTRR
jgi:GTP-binding protein HflX